MTAKPILCLVPSYFEPGLPRPTRARTAGIADSFAYFFFSSFFFSSLPAGAAPSAFFAPASRAISIICAEKIRIILAKPYVLTIKAKNNTEIQFEHHCTSSIGMVMFINHEYSPEELIKRADSEMYQAKETGRDRVSVSG